MDAVTGGAIGLVAGSGIDLRPVLDRIDAEIPFHDVPGLCDGGVAGHASVFVRGESAGRPAVVQCGRLHPYEGRPFDAVVRTVDALHAFGVRTVIFTNAVGGLLPGLQAGDLVAADAVRAWPYRAFALPTEQTPDFLVPHCDAVGTYWWMHGPCYETPAEIAALRRLGAATVGMSTAPELVRCAQLGMRAAVVSCVTNLCGDPEPVTHEKVLAAGRRASEGMVRVMRHAVSALGA